jgi:hypothetical protein
MLEFLAQKKSNQKFRKMSEFLTQKNQLKFSCMNWQEKVKNADF